MTGNPFIIWMAAASPLRFSPQMTATMPMALARTPRVRLSPRAQWARSWTGVGDDVAKSRYLWSNPELASSRGSPAGRAARSLAAWAGGERVGPGAQQDPGSRVVEHQRVLPDTDADELPAEDLGSERRRRLKRRRQGSALLLETFVP